MTRIIFSPLIEMIFNLCCPFLKGILYFANLEDDFLRACIISEISVSHGYLLDSISIVETCLHFNPFHQFGKKNPREYFNLAEFTSSADLAPCQSRPLKFAGNLTYSAKWKNKLLSCMSHLWNILPPLIYLLCRSPLLKYHPLCVASTNLCIPFLAPPWNDEKDYDHRYVHSSSFDGLQNLQANLILPKTKFVIMFLVHTWLWPYFPALIHSQGL